MKKLPIICLFVFTALSAFAACPAAVTEQQAQHIQEMSKDLARQQALSDSPQTLTAVTGDAIVQRAPRLIGTLPNGQPGLTGGEVNVTLITVQQPTPLPTVAPQDSRIQTTVNGLDNIETKAILPEHLGVDQLDAIKKIADNGTLIAQQRFAVEQYRINTETQLEWLRISKSFVLWGFLFSIPFLLTLYWIMRNAVAGWRGWQKDKLEFKQKEWEIAERLTHDK